MSGAPAAGREQWLRSRASTGWGGVLRVAEGLRVCSQCGNQFSAGPRACCELRGALSMPRACLYDDTAFEDDEQDGPGFRDQLTALPDELAALLDSIEQLARA